MFRKTSKISQEFEARRRSQRSYFRKSLFEELESRRLLVNSIDVTTLQDENDGSLDPNLGTGVSLREAIIYSQPNDIVTLPAGSFMLTRSGSGEDAGAVGDLDIRHSLRIRGQGSGQTIIDAGGVDRVFHIQRESAEDILDVSIGGLTIQGGGSVERGGGLLNEGGTVEVLDAEFRQNSADLEGAAIFNSVLDSSDPSSDGLVRLLNTPLLQNSVAGLPDREFLNDIQALMDDYRDDLVSGVNLLFGRLTNSLEDALSAVDVPLIGDQITEGLRPMFDSLEAFRTDAIDFLEGVLATDLPVDGPSQQELFQNALYLFLGPGDEGFDRLDPQIANLLRPVRHTVENFGLGILLDGTDSDSIVSPTDILVTLGEDNQRMKWLQFDFHLGQLIDVDIPEFDLGLGSFAQFVPGAESNQVDIGDFLDTFGFSVTAENGLRVTSGWDLRLGVGISERLDQGVYLNSGARLGGPSGNARLGSGGVDSEPVEELRLYSSVIVAPSDDSNVFRLFEDVVTSPNLRANVSLGKLVQSEITDGTAPDIRITAWDSLPFGLISGSPGFDISFEIIVDNDDPIRIDYSSPVGETIPQLLLNLNAQLLGLSPDNFDLTNLLPSEFPKVIFTIDPSAIDRFFNPGNATTPFLVLKARVPEVNHLEIRSTGAPGTQLLGEDNLGFRATQYEDRRVRGMGFANNAFSTPQGDGTQRLSADLPAPAEGINLDDPLFYVTIGGQRVVQDGVEFTQGGTPYRIFFREILNRDDIVTIEALNNKLNDLLGGQLASSGLPADLVTFERFDVDGRPHFELVARPYPDGSPAPLVTVTYEAVDQSKLDFTATLDIVSPTFTESLLNENPNNQVFFDRLPIGTLQASSDTSQVLKPKVKADAQIRLHVNGNTDHILGFIEQVSPLADGALALPEFEYDFKVDANIQFPPDEDESGDGGDDPSMGDDLPFEIETFQFDNISLDVRDFLEKMVVPLADMSASALEPYLQLIGGSDVSGQSLLDQELPLLGNIVNRSVTLRDVLGDTADDFALAVDQIAEIVRQASDIGADVAAFLQTPEFAQLLDENGRFTFGGLELVLDPDHPLYFPKARVPIPIDLKDILDGFSELGPSNFLRTFTAFNSVQPAGFNVDLFLPENVFNLLTGEPLNIVSFGLPTIDFDGSASFGFDFRDLGFDIVADASFDSNLRLAYDSLGLERMVSALRSGATPDFRDILDGFAIQNNPNGFEFGGDVRFVGSGSVSVGPFSAEGHVSITGPGGDEGPTDRAFVGLEIADPNNDGRLRLDELSHITNGFRSLESLACMFNVTAGAEVDIGGSAEIDLGLLGSENLSGDLGLDSGTFDLAQLIANIFPNCAPVTNQPILAEPLSIDGQPVLRLNVGPFAQARLFGDTDDEDTGASISVQQVGDQLLVSGYGVVNQQFDGPFSRILAFGSGRNDSIDLSGVISIPTEMIGNAGNDVLVGGQAADRILGGDGDDQLTGNSGDDFIDAGSGRNSVSDGLGNDFIDLRLNQVGASLVTSGGRDIVMGTPFNDNFSVGGLDNETVEFYGLDGDDSLTGGSGNDLLDGGRGQDNLVGGAGDDELFGGSDADVLVGGLGRDTLLAGQGADWIVASFGDLLVDGESGRDRLQFLMSDRAHHGQLTSDTYVEVGGETIPYLNFSSLEVQLADATIVSPNQLMVDGVEQQLSIYGGSGPDHITIASLIANEVPTSIQLQDGDDSLTVLSSLRNISFDGGLNGAVGDSLTVDLRAGNAPSEGEISAALISGLGLGTVEYRSAEALTLQLGSGEQRLQVTDTSASTLTQILTGPGNDEVEVLSIGGRTSVSGGPGDDQVIVSIPGNPSDLPVGSLADLTFDVEQLVVDNSTSNTSVDWQFVDGLISANGIPLLDSLGAVKTIIQGSETSTSDSLLVEDQVSVPQTVDVRGVDVRIDEGVDVLFPDNITELTGTAISQTVDGLLGARHVAVQDDFIYVAGVGEDAISVFRNQGNGLEFVQVIRRDIYGIEGLQSITDIAVSQDGTQVYVASSATNGVTIFDRSSASGRLSYSQFIPVSQPIESLAIPESGDAFFAAGTASLFVLIPAEGYVQEIPMGSLFGGLRDIDVTFDFGIQILAVAGTASFPVLRQFSMNTIRDSFVAFRAQSVLPSLGNSVTIRSRFDAFVAHGTGVAAFTFQNGLISRDTRSDIRGPLALSTTTIPTPNSTNVAVGFANERSRVVDFGRFRFGLFFGSVRIESEGQIIVPRTFAGPNTTVNLNGQMPLDVSRTYEVILESAEGIEFGRGSRTVLHTDALVENETTRIGIFGGTLTYSIRRFSELQGASINGTLRRFFNTTDTPGINRLDGLAGGILNGSESFTAGATANEAQLSVIGNSTTALRDGQQVTTIPTARLGADHVRTIISSDGAFAYVASRRYGTITQFSRDTTSGQLLDRLNVIPAGIDSQSSLAISSDGQRLFVANRYENELRVYGTSAEDGVTPDLRLLQAFVDGLAGVDGLASPGDIAVSPDGGTVFVSDAQDGRIAIFDYAEQMLSFSGSFTDSRLIGPERLTLSADGNQLLITSESAQSVYVLSRNPATNELSFQQAFTEQVDGVTGLSAPTGLSLSPDGNSAYVVGGIAGAIPILGRGFDGMWTFRGSVANGQNGVAGLSEISDVVISDDGNFLFAAGGSDSIVVFARSATGDLTIVQRVRDGAGGFSGLLNPSDLTIHSDGSLYVSSGGGDMGGVGAVTQLELDDMIQELRAYQVMHQGVDSLTVRSSSETDFIDVGEVPIPLLIQSGASSDIVNLRNSPADTLVQTQGGNDVIRILNTGLGALRVEAGAGDDQITAFSTSEGQLDISGGTGDDWIRVAGGRLESEVFIHGNDHPNGDTFVFDSHGQLTSPVDPQPTAGNVRIDGATNGVTYDTVESLLIIGSPLADVGGPYVTAEGDGIEVSAAATLIPTGQQVISYAWSIGGNALNINSETINLSWGELTALGVVDNGTYQVSVEVTTQDPLSLETFSDAASARLSVSDTPPELSIAGDSEIEQGARYRLDLSAMDFGDDTIARWVVNWGDGSPPQTYLASTAIVFHTFNFVGGFDIQVQAFDEDGGPYSGMQQSVAVTAARHIAGPSSGSEGDVYSLQLNNPSQASIALWRINWGDGNIVTFAGDAPSVSHTYLDDGTYRITASTVDIDGSRRELNSLDLLISNAAPSVVLNGPTNALQGSTITLSAAATDPGTSDQLTYEFDLDQDGLFETVSSTANVSTTVRRTGSQTFRVRVRDDDGATSSISLLEVQVDNVVPTVDQIKVLTDPALEGSQVLLRVEAHDNGNPDETLLYEFDFDNDGIFETRQATPVAAVTYDDNGVYPIHVRVTDDDGGIAESSLDLTVSNGAPQLIQAVPQGRSAEGLPQTLVVSASDPAGENDTITYRFDLDGDGILETYSDNGIVDYQFDDEGLYTIGIELADEDGGVSSHAIEIRVTNVSPVLSPVANQLLTPPLAGQFDLVASFNDPGDDTWTANVDYGDGSALAPATVDPQSQEILLSHNYADDGVYPVTIFLTDGDSGADRLTFSVEVQLNTPPVAIDDFIAADEDSPVSFNVLLDNGLGADADAEGNIDASLTEAISFPAQGLLTNDGHGQFTYDPQDAFQHLAAYEQAQVLFAYQIEDAFGEQAVATATVTIQGVNDHPTIVSVTSVGDGAGVFPIGALELSGSFEDIDLNDTHSGMWTINRTADGETTSQSMVATIDQASNTVADTIDFAIAGYGPGVYTVSLTIDDGQGGVTTSNASVFVIYDAEGGFVTGGGWIDSPVGADRLNPHATGKANFGFVSKYGSHGELKGNTQFHLKVGDLKFKSSSYDWLVVNGREAMFQGHGTINGDGDYRITVTATDGVVAGGDGIDRLRIVIHDTATGQLRYDNRITLEDTALGRGSIVIHQGQQYLRAGHAPSQGLGETLTQERLNEEAASAIQFLASRGVDVEPLRNIRVLRTDLHQDALGIASVTTNYIWIDSTAAGFGWRLDDSQVGIDLQSVLLHEFGHALGLDDEQLGDDLHGGAADESWIEKYFLHRDTETQPTPPLPFSLPLLAVRSNFLIEQTHVARTSTNNRTLDLSGRRDVAAKVRQIANIDTVPHGRSVISNNRDDYHKRIDALLGQTLGEDESMLDEFWLDFDL